MCCLYRRNQDKLVWCTKQKHPFPPHVVMSYRLELRRWVWLINLWSASSYRLNGWTRKWTEICFYSMELSSPHSYVFRKNNLVIMSNHVHLIYTHLYINVMYTLVDLCLETHVKNISRMNQSLLLAICPTWERIYGWGRWGIKMVTVKQYSCALSVYKIHCLH